MKPMLVMSLAALLFCHGLVAGAHASRLTAFEDALPFDAYLTMAVASGRIAGREVSIARFESGLAIEEAMRRLRTESMRLAPGSMFESRTDGWIIVSRRLADSILTIQLRARPQGGVEGVVSHWRLDAEPRDESQQAMELLPHSFRLVRTVSSRDAGVRVTTVAAITESKLAEAWRQVQEQLAARGYRIQSVGRFDPSIREARFATWVRGEASVTATLDGRGWPVALVLHKREVAP